MISADFYPTQQTQFTVEYTDVINNLTYDDPETMAEPYYMGYVKWDDVPTMQHMSKLNIVTGIEEAYVEFVDVTQTENVPWFFTGRYSTSTSSGSGIYIADESTNKYVHPTLGTHNNYGFFNSLEIQRVGSYGSFNLYVFYNIINPATTPPTISQGGSYLQYNSTNISFADFLKWMNGEIQLFISITIGAVQENIYFDFSDFLTGACDKEHTNGELQVWLVDVFTPYNARDYQPNNTLANWSNQNATLKLHADIDGDIKPFLTNGLYWHSGYSDERYIRLDNVQTLSHYVSGYNGYVMGGFNGRIPYTFFAYGSTGRYYVFGNLIVWKYTSSQTRIARIIPITDIVNFLAPLATRISTTGVNPAYGYADTIAYPLFNADNSPKWEYATGLQADIQDDLQPWQYTNITANTFTADDIPEYVPPTPEPGDDQGSNSGSVLRPTTLGVGGTNGFITQYSMTAAQIAEIGRLLWYKFSDASAVEQYVKNYMFFTVSTTGTLNLSNLLDYFVSLRVYPFPLINVPSHAAAGQDMWIGAGIVPLTFSTNLHTINNYADYIDAGSCTIPRYYNDFRDFAHTQIMLYLPYCGTVQLNPADVVGSTLHAQYAVDFATGGVTAYVDCTTWDGSQFVIAVLTGSIGADIPLTASNAAQIAARIAGDALNFAGTVGEAVSSDVGRSAQAIGSAATGDVVGAAIGVANTYAGRIGGALDVAQTGLQIATAEGVKMPMLSGGRGFGSFGAPQTAYVQIRRGIYAEGQQPPQGFKEAYGEAYSKPVQVSSCSGFTVFANVDTSGLQCDAMEREQVKKMMQAGIYI